MKLFVYPSVSCKTRAINKLNNTNYESYYSLKKLDSFLLFDIRLILMVFYYCKTHIEEGNFAF